jgi:G6PDH family F420-dependent oxidoreductase
MVEFGYSLSSEEFASRQLVEQAVAAEEAGFSFALISDHFHPWLDVQGHSPFVWSIIGAIAASTDRLRLGTGVTCPTIRIHPAIIAQAAATAADLMPGRFFLGLGSGENLNEHILGERWPPADVRLDMLSEAIAVIRELWKGKLTDFEGDYFYVENARLYTLPTELPPIYVAASGRRAAEIAGQAEGLIATSPSEEVVKNFEAAGGKGKPKYGQLAACWAEDEATARRTALQLWPIAALKGALHQELPLPEHFKDATSHVTEEMIGELLPCGPDPEKHRAQIQQFIDQGFDHLYIHQIGPDQAGFLRFYKDEVLPAFATPAASGGRNGR